MGNLNITYINVNSSKNLQINKKMSMDSDPLVSWQVLFYVWHKNKYEKRIFHELSPGMVRGSCTWQVLFKTVLLQCVHITGNYFPSHFIQTYIDCDHYLFAIPDYRRDDAKGEIWRSWAMIFFTIYMYDYYYYYYLFSYHGDQKYMFP